MASFFFSRKIAAIIVERCVGTMSARETLSLRAAFAFGGTAFGVEGAVRFSEVVFSAPAFNKLSHLPQLVLSSRIERGSFVEARGRPWLVEAVDDLEPGLTTVRLSCIADDAQGEQVEILWDAEIGASRPG